MRPSIAVVFDLDDTLYPEREFVRSGMRATGEWLLKHDGLEGFAREAWSLFEGGRRGDIFDETLRRLGRHASPDLIQRLIEVYRGHVPTDLTLFPDAQGALERLVASHDLGLLTDGFLKTQTAKVRALGIAGAFKSIVYSDELGRRFWKPSPTPFQEMMRRLAREGQDCIYIGDNPTKDFAGAKALGWRTIQIRRPGGVYAAEKAAPGDEADCVIASLERLEDSLTLAKRGSSC